MERIYTVAQRVFDPIEHFWEHPNTQRAVAGGIVVVFLAALAGIELRRQGLLPEPLASATPTSHYYAVNVAFTCLLILEVLSFIFVLPSSVSQALGKQLELLSLILLRNSFKHLIHLPEPIDLSGGVEPLYPILSDGVGALVIFFLIGVYYRTLKSTPAITCAMDRYRFSSVKKGLALMLLVSFLGLGVRYVYLKATGQTPQDFFETVYTVLIFSDILIVFLSHRFVPCFHAVFRNSGYAISTLLMRMSLTAPIYYDVGIGIASALLALGITKAYNHWTPPPPERKPEKPDHSRLEGEVVSHGH
ncbi:MAG: hypothetical protein LDL30_00940 [Desulfovibrio sp.]|nr:hypothetical protein [Desulfovibrio sp.]